jgi:hypothetical protein
MPEELYTSRDFCELAEKFEELKRENEELVSDKTYLINAAMDGGDKYYYTAHDIAYRDLERKCKALEAENAKLEAERRWIPVSERLPVDNSQVLFYDNDGIIYKGVHSNNTPQWESNGGYYWHGSEYKYVTHWMPLPEPPEEERNDY